MYDVFSKQIAEGTGLSDRDNYSTFWMAAESHSRLKQDVGASLRGEIALVFRIVISDVPGAKTGHVVPSEKDDCRL